MEVTSVTGRSPRGEQQAAYRGVEASLFVPPLAGVSG